jgi:hypothetical protein
MYNTGGHSWLVSAIFFLHIRLGLSNAEDNKDVAYGDDSKWNNRVRQQVNNVQARIVVFIPFVMFYSAEMLLIDVITDEIMSIDDREHADDDVADYLRTLRSTIPTIHGYARCGKQTIDG